MYVQSTTWWGPQSFSQFRKIFSMLLILPSINKPIRHSCSRSVKKSKANRTRRRLEMEGEERQSKSRVVNIDSARAWDFHVNRATKEGCPVSEMRQVPHVHAYSPVSSDRSHCFWPHKDVDFRWNIAAWNEDSTWVNLCFRFQEEIESDNDSILLVPCHQYQRVH